MTIMLLHPLDQDASDRTPINCPKARRLWAMISTASAAISGYLGVFWGLLPAPAPDTLLRPACFMTITASRRPSIFSQSCSRNTRVSRCSR
jgi:hypothetical protein